MYFDHMNMICGLCEKASSCIYLEDLCLVFKLFDQQKQDRSKAIWSLI